MPLKNVICPDGKRVPVEQCLAGNCPNPTRCRPLSFLRVCLSERKWAGVPSVTQLISGTRYAAFKILKDYDESASSGVFKALGTTVHAALDDEDDVSFVEEHFELNDIGGTADRIEAQPNGEMWLIDHKVVGSYKVSKALGYVDARENVLDDAGNQVYFKSGAKKGQPKTRKIVVLDVKQADRKDWTLQLNYYRIMVEHRLGYKISRLKIHVSVRDGGTMAATMRMVTKHDYYIDIDIIPDDTVLAYFEYKKKKLLDAVDGHTVPGPCSAHECWDGRKCKSDDYCPVRNYCIAMGDNPFVGAADDEEEEA